MAAFSPKRLPLPGAGLLQKEAVAFENGGCERTRVLLSGIADHGTDVVNTLGPSHDRQCQNSKSEGTPSPLCRAKSCWNEPQPAQLPEQIDAAGGSRRRHSEPTAAFLTSDDSNRACSGCCGSPRPLRAEQRSFSGQGKLVFALDPSIIPSPQPSLKPWAAPPRPAAQMRSRQPKPYFSFVGSRISAPYLPMGRLSHASKMHLLIPAGAAAVSRSAVRPCPSLCLPY
ncbi:uncharacterized protein A4U43_UnF780 [Asparagus officinalis]|uniref:Uncharacterized protein n=1 Tax=Asparagus officinalis TaxID=4686 RepID=A0A1R3L7N6_ASPOF|nr:uncharacterized protein A4U43_UnF780 [Asparagus officinalis]